MHGVLKLRTESLLGMEGAVAPGASGEMKAAASVPTELGLPQELGRAVAGAESSQNSVRQTWQEGSEGGDVWTVLVLCLQSQM